MLDLLGSAPYLLRVMFDQLHAHILKRIDLSKKDLQRAQAYFIPKKMRKGQFLVHEGAVCGVLAYVVSGCLRQYLIDAEGVEHVVQFALEDGWISDLQSFLSGKSASYNIDALEDCTLLLVDRQFYNDLCDKIPAFNRFFRLLLEANHIANQQRITASLSRSAEEQYLHLIHSHPSLEQRVPQNQIASYLGITPQSLSRIRKELTEK
jgi:CRP-like cAMP-binding protein